MWELKFHASNSCRTNRTYHTFLSAHVHAIVRHDVIPIPLWREWHLSFPGYFGYVLPLFPSLALPLDCVAGRDAGKGVRHARFNVHRDVSLGTRTFFWAFAHRMAELVLSLFLMLRSVLFSCFTSVIVLAFSAFPSCFMLAYLCVSFLFFCRGFVCNKSFLSS